MIETYKKLRRLRVSEGKVPRYISDFKALSDKYKNFNGDTSDKPAYVVPAGETVAQGPPIAADQIAWSFLEGTNDVASLHAFSEAFPDSAKQGQASARISALEGGMASPVLAVAVDTDPIAEAPLLLAKGVGTAEDG